MGNIGKRGKTGENIEKREIWENRKTGETGKRGETGESIEKQGKYEKT